MSYSFSIQASDKEEASSKVSVELAKVVEQQPIHKKDVDQALAAAESMIALLRHDATKDISVSVSGSVSWEGDSADPDCELTSASLSTSAYLVTKASE